MLVYKTSLEVLAFSLAHVYTPQAQASVATQTTAWPLKHAAATLDRTTEHTGLKNTHSSE